MSHHCHAAGCTKNVPPEMFMCKKHWFSLSKRLRTLIWATYRPGQCDDWNISHQYATVAQEAVREVAVKEGRTEDEINAACRVYRMLDPKRYEDGAV